MLWFTTLRAFLVNNNDCNPEGVSVAVTQLTQFQYFTDKLILF